MPRAVLIVMDSFGIGSAADAVRYGDAGADTLGHIAEACARGEADGRGTATGALRLPSLSAKGLGHAALMSAGAAPTGLVMPDTPTAQFGFAVETSKGKDTPSGHWEIAGLPVSFDWGYFPETVPTFPDDLIAEIVARCDLAGVLGNCHASGTTIIAELGAEHIRTGKPIVYTSADSVFQIAAHEEHFGLERLYDLCRATFELTAPLNIGRVIARPFVGETPGDFERTGNRRDFAIPPNGPTLLNIASDAGREVISVGKISDIFAGSGITRSMKASGNNAIMDNTLAAMEAAPDGALVFANFVDFDMHYGHRRDIPGYAAAVEGFECRR
ncbi:MAG: phosphopentomutase, partial [Pseudomonadota bacterium]